MDHGARQPGAPPEDCDSAMGRAARQGHASVVSALVSAGASVDKAMEDGWTPLHIAAQQGHASAVSALVSAGASVDQVDKNGRTALDVALQNGTGELHVVDALRKASSAK